MGEIVAGRNPVRELLRAGRRGVHEVLATARVAGEEWLHAAAVPVRIVERSQLDELAGVEHQGVVALADRYPYVDADALLAERDALVLALDEVQDPHNFGSVCRIADAVGASGVVICERRAVGVTAAVCRASAGAVEHVRVARVKTLPRWLERAKEAGAWVYLADVEGDPWHRYDYGGRVVLVFGSEGRGARRTVRAVSDAVVALEQRGRVGSLNVAAAAAALAYGVSALRQGILQPKDCS